MLLLINYCIVILYVLFNGLLYIIKAICSPFFNIFKNYTIAYKIIELYLGSIESMLIIGMRFPVLIIMPKQISTNSCISKPDATSITKVVTTVNSYGNRDSASFFQ